MLTRGIAVGGVGPLDERFFMYAEDVDWAYRFKQKGWKIYYYPEVEVLHHKRGSAIKIAPQMIKEFYKSIREYDKKYYRDTTNPVFNFLLDLFLALRLRISLLTWHIFHKWV